MQAIGYDRMSTRTWAVAQVQAQAALTVIMINLSVVYVRLPQPTRIWALPAVATSACQSWPSQMPVSAVY